MTFIRKYDSCSESSEENISAEELAETYKVMLTEWKKYCMREEKHKKTISPLLM